MLIVYRTNAPFAGQIAFVHKGMAPKEIEKWAGTEQAKDLAFIEINEALADQQIIADLVNSDERYTVNPVTKVLLKSGSAAVLGYDAVDVSAKIAELDSDPLISQLWTATDAQMTTFAGTKTTAQLFVLTWKIIRRVAIAAGVRK